MASTKVLVLVKVILSVDVPPAAMLTGLKLLEIVGGLAVTVSRSLAEHMPLVQELEGLVLVTPDGGATVAVFETVVCACANPGNTNANTNASKSPTTKRVVPSLTFTCKFAQTGRRQFNKISFRDRHQSNRTISHLPAWAGGYASLTECRG